MYVKLVDYYLMFEYSIRTADFELYQHVLQKITNIFFTMNHQNYARYMTVYLDKLSKIEETHPGLLSDSKHCFLGICRTSNPFCRIPVDLTLEQTINADAASKASGIINLTDSFSARQKWSVTHALRTHAITKILEFCDIKKSYNTVKDLKKSIITRYQKNLEILLEHIKTCTNPFSNDLLESHLYNISSGQTVNNNVYDF